MTDFQSDAPHQARGILFVLSGPSGVGKGTVLRRVISRMPRLRSSVSVTTRPPRPDELDGRDYFFATQADFIRMRDAGEMLEFAEVHGHWYGTPRPWVLEQLASGTDVVLEIDVQGAIQARHLFPQAVLIFVAPPSLGELAVRLHRRSTEDEATMRRRLANARKELSQVHQYDYLLINDDLSEATDQLWAIVTAERLRPWRQDIDYLLEDHHG